MKQIKDLKITTNEGFSVKNLQRFPSMEYGDEGGLSAELYYNGHKILDVFNDGNGGMSNNTTTDYYRSNKDKIDNNALAFLKRCDTDWDKYDFLRDKKAKDLDDDDYYGIVEVIEDRYYTYKDVKKFFASGNIKSVAALSNWRGNAYLTYRVNDITIDEVKKYVDKNIKDKDEFDNIAIYTSDMDFATM